MEAVYEIQENKSETFWWELVHTDGQVIADLGEGYKSETNAMNSTKSIEENTCSTDYQR
jgi:uncharacterized protein YegP (UPF0339 family)